MFRSATDALRVLDDLKGRGIALHMLDLGGDVTGNGVSKLIFTILSAVAEAERDRIRERIRDTRAKLKAEGRFAGGSAPFGWRVRPGGELVEHQEQQRARTVMVAMRRNGLSLRKIQGEMARQGVRVSHEAIRRITDEALTAPASPMTVRAPRQARAEA